MTTKIIHITACDECKHFDNEFYTYNQWCTLLDRIIPAEESDFIPDDCPLPDKQEEVK